MTFAVAGKTLLLTPGEAYTRSVPFSILNQAEVATLEAICDFLLPGARENGVAHFVDRVSWCLTPMTACCLSNVLTYSHLIGIFTGRHWQKSTA